MKVDYCIADDWQGLYVNGFLQEESHEISTIDVLSNMARLYESGEDLFVEQIIINQDWIEECGSFPIEFEDIPQDEIEVSHTITF